jgi:hypothetical protein
MAINDTCVFLEAETGDGGVHTTPTWWLSPDLVVAGPDALGRATPGVPNTVNVRVHKKNNCTINGDTVLVDVYVGNPALAMTPGSNTTKITNAAGRPPGFVAPASLSVSGTVVPITWNLGTTAPEAPGHKCLIARCYPDSDTPPAGTFNLPTDQHVVQHNICIIPCESPCDLEVTTTNLNREKQETVRIRAVADIAPSKHVLASVRPLLRRVKDFKRLRTQKIPKFWLQFRKSVEVRVADFVRGPSAKGYYGRLRVPNYTAQLEMKPKQRMKFMFMADMEEANFGEACIFHLTHSGANNRVLGGLTIITVRTKEKW